MTYRYLGFYGGCEWVGWFTDSETIWFSGYESCWWRHVLYWVYMTLSVLYMSNVIVSHCVSKVAGDQVKGNWRSRSAGLSHILEWAYNLRFMSFKSCARHEGLTRPSWGDLSL
jgi:hypothetical protein